MKLDPARIVAEPTHGHQIVVVLERPDEQYGSGPWTLVTDEGPVHGGQGSAPPPVYMAFAALAACTAVTVGGVARRRKMELDRLRVEIVSVAPFDDKIEAEEAAIDAAVVAKRDGVKRLILEGRLSEQDVAILTRAARNCPVHRMMENGAIQFSEEVVYNESMKEAQDGVQVLG
jgi:putative redox protein